MDGRFSVVSTMAFFSFILTFNVDLLLLMLAVILHIASFLISVDVLSFKKKKT